jgi:hypothetical protein
LTKLPSVHFGKEITFGTGIGTSNITVKNHQPFRQFDFNSKLNFNAGYIMNLTFSRQIYQSGFLVGLILNNQSFHSEYDYDLRFAIIEQTFDYNFSFLELPVIFQQSIFKKNSKNWDLKFCVGYQLSCKLGVSSTIVEKPIKVNPGVSQSSIDALHLSSKDKIDLNSFGLGPNAGVMVEPGFKNKKFTFSIFYKNFRELTTLIPDASNMFHFNVFYKI